MKSVAIRRAAATALLFAVDLFAGQPSSPAGSKFENQYLTIVVQAGWTVRESADPALNLTHGKYVLSINPMFTHASGVTCGRFSEITRGMLSVDAVMGNVDQPAGGWECSASSSKNLVVNKTISLGNLYTDSSKSGHGCIFPASGRSLWFGSLFCGEGSESEYTITMAYDTANVNSLPDKHSSDLQQVLRDVATMLKTLNLKPPLLISKISPDLGPAGTTVTVYGSGFNASGYSVAVVFKDFPNNPMPSPVIADDGKSLTFQVPTSVNTISCPTGRIDVGEWCVPAPANHEGINDCPQRGNGAANFCGIPIPPTPYQLSVTFEGSGISSNPVSFTVTEPEPSPVSVSLMYPNYLVSDGDTITVRGRGFMTSGNNVQIGSASVINVPSLDGKTITFQAPTPSGISFIRGIRIYSVSISNSNGHSNSISFDYR